MTVAIITNISTIAVAIITNISTIAIAIAIIPSSHHRRHHWDGQAQSHGRHAAPGGSGE